MKRSEVIRRLKAIGVESPEAEAGMLFDALDKGDLPVYADGELDIDEAKLEDVFHRRAAGEPMQYILGVAWFWRECYEVSPDCLIPRSDTEHLVEYAVKHLPKGARFLDMCTGSGCVAISILASRPDLTAVAVDNSPKALDIAQRNALRNNVAERVTFLLADALSYLPDQPFDGFFSNPPYIEKRVIPTLAQEVLHEPLSALDGGQDGLDFYRYFCKHLSYYIYKEGICAFEIGYDQGQALQALSRENGLSCHILKDYGGCDRVAAVGFLE